MTNLGQLCKTIWDAWFTGGLMPYSEDDGGLLFEAIALELLTNVDDYPTLVAAANDAWNQTQAIINDLERIQEALLKLEKE